VSALKKSHGDLFTDQKKTMRFTHIRLKDTNTYKQFGRQDGETVLPKDGYSM